MLQQNFSVNSMQSMVEIEITDLIKFEYTFYYVIK